MIHMLLSKKKFQTRDKLLFLQSLFSVSSIFALKGHLRSFRSWVCQELLIGDSGICQIQGFYQKVDQKKSDFHWFWKILIMRFRCPSAWCCIYFKSDDERLPNDQRRTERWPSTITSSNKPMHYDHINHLGSQCRNDFRRSNGKFRSNSIINIKKCIKMAISGSKITLFPSSFAQWWV